MNPGRTKSVRCSHRSCARGRCRRPAVTLAVKAALLGIVAVCAVRAAGRPPRCAGADYKAQQLKEIVGYLGEHFTEPLSPMSAVAAEFGLSPQYFSTFSG